MDHMLVLLISLLSRVDMLGSLEDWQKLKSKFESLSDLLDPIKADIGLDGPWWKTAGGVFEKLLETYQGNPNKEWWERIIVDESYDEFVVCGFSPEVGFTGWFMTDFLNQTFADAPTGLASAPLTIRQVECSYTEGRVVFLISYLHCICITIVMAILVVLKAAKHAKLFNSNSKGSDLLVGRSQLF